jgi:hypothetical protein
MPRKAILLVGNGVSIVIRYIQVDTSSTKCKSKARAQIKGRLTPGRCGRTRIKHPTDCVAGLAAVSNHSQQQTRVPGRRSGTGLVILGR